MSPNAGGGGSCGFLANEYSCAYRAQVNFGDLTTYLTYAGDFFHIVAQRRGPTKCLAPRFEPETYRVKLATTSLH
jgi:hypothetical protein